jgi:hypothetical protein
MSPSLFYDRQGRPLPNVLAWAKLFEDVEYQVVAQEDVLGSTGEMAWVSTVWLGVPQNLSGLEGYGPPIIFETAIFRSGEDVEIWDRYATEQAALDGHRFLIQTMTDGVTLSDDDPPLERSGDEGDQDAGDR